MKEILSKLINLQSQDTEILRVQKLFETRTPEHEASLKEKAELDSQLDELKIKIEDQNSVKSQAQAVLDMNQDRLKKTEDKSEVIQNQKEYVAIQKERDTINEHIRKIEIKRKDSEEILTKLDESSAELTLKLEEVNEGIKNFEEQRNTSLTEEKNKMELALKAKEEIRSELSPSWLTKYDRIFNFAKGLAVAPIDHKNCGGCKLSIRPQLVITVQRAEVMVHCEACQRFLYWPEADSQADQEVNA